MRILCQIIVLFGIFFNTYSYILSSKINIFNRRFISKYRIYQDDSLFCKLNNISELSMIGISYHNNTINDIEKISIQKKDLNNFYNYVYKNNITDEIVVLSTCNRFELYMYSKNADISKEKIIEFLIKKESYDKLKNKLYFYKNDDVLRHLYGVSSGIKSMIFGEKQIHDQVNIIYNNLKKNNIKLLSNVFMSSLECSEEIRKIKDFNKCDSSISSISIDFYKNNITNTSKILIIGSGEMSKLLITNFRNKQIYNLSLINRNEENAIKLKKNFPNMNINIKDYNNELRKLCKYYFEYDYVFVCTSSPEPIIIFDKTYKLSINKNINIMDLSVPKNVEIKCKSNKNINLNTIEDLRNIEKNNQELNKKIINECYILIEKYINNFNNKNLDLE